MYNLIWKRKAGIGISLLLMASAMLSACSDGEKPAGSTVGPSAAPTSETAVKAENPLEEKFTIDLMAQANAGGGWPDQNHPVIQELNKKFNIDLKVNWVPSASYEEKLNVLAASNQLPDIYNVKNEDFLKWVDKGIFRDVTKDYNNAKYPNFKKNMPEEQMKISNPKGKYFGFPVYQNEVIDTLVIRQDWLEKLGLKTPTTIDEFYEVAKAFALKDPDGNGKNDTVGITMLPSFLDADHIKAAFGLANGWKLEEGKLVPWRVQSKELRDVVAFFRKAYEEGVLDKDFPILKGQETLKKFEANKVGFGYANGYRINEVTLPPLQKLTPDAKVAQLIPPKGPDGKQGTRTRTSGINKTVINAKIDEKKQERIIMLLDYLLSDEGNDLLKHGVEGIHYKKTAGDKYEKLEAYDKDRPNILLGWFFKRHDPGFLVYNWMDPNEVKQIDTYFSNSQKFVVRDAAAGLVSDTDVKVGKNLDQKFEEGITKIIVGKEPLDKLDDLIKEWRSGGGDQIIKEINEAYSRMN